MNTTIQKSKYYGWQAKSAKATEKAISEFHQETLKDIEAIRAQVRAFYELPLTNGIRTA